MKVIVTFILVLFFTSMGMAQNCAFAKNETDKFTKSRALYTEPVNVIAEKVKLKKVYTIAEIEMQAKYENNTYLINVDYHFAMGMSSANTNDKLMLLLADGATVEARCIQNMPGQMIKGGTVVLSYNFEVEEADFKKLAESDITDVRMTAQINQVEFAVDKKVKTRNLFKCIIENK